MSKEAWYSSHLLGSRGWNFACFRALGVDNVPDDVSTVAADVVFEHHGFDGQVQLVEPAHLLTMGAVCQVVSFYS